MPTPEENKLAIEAIDRKIEDLKKELKKKETPLLPEKEFTDVPKDGQRMVEELEIGKLKNIVDKTEYGLLTSAQKTDLTDGNASTAHKHDHGGMDGLDDDDHGAIYYTETEVDTLVGAKIGNVVEDTTPQLGGDLDLNSKKIDFPSTADVSDCKDEDDMASDSATMLATQQSIKKYVDDNASKITSYTVTLADCVNTTSSTTVVEATIPANTVADGDVIELFAVLGCKATVGGGWNQYVDFDAGYASDFIDCGHIDWAGDGNEHLWFVKVYMMRVGSDVVGVKADNNTPGQEALTKHMDVDMSVATNVCISSSVDFTSAQTVVLNVIHETASADVWVKPKGARVIKYGV